MLLYPEKWETLCVIILYKSFYEIHTKCPPHQSTSLKIWKDYIPVPCSLTATQTKYHKIK